jgi:hypothetical protein
MWLWPMLAALIAVHRVVAGQVAATPSRAA